MLFFMLEDHVDARGSVGAHLRREARSEAIGHVATSESTSA
jgi:hypothetical protein